MKPRKSWEPEYRFGGSKADFFTPMPLGTPLAYRTPKPKKRKRK